MQLHGNPEQGDSDQGSKDEDGYPEQRPHPNRGEISAPGRAG
jgi:hypothetical protein